jgi:hypothetical protein
MASQAEVIQEPTMPAESVSTNSLESDYFISKAQVLRRGMVIGSEANFSRAEAVEVAKALIENRTKLNTAILKILRRMIAGSSPSVSEKPVLHQYKKVILNLPHFKVGTKSRELEISLSCTVCEESTRSKLWVKISHLEEDRELAKSISNEVIGIFFKFYEDTARSVQPDLGFEKEFEFEIYGAHSSDEGVASIFNTLLSNRKPDVVIDDILWKERKNALARVFYFANGEQDFDSDGNALRSKWKKSNFKSADSAANVVPISVQENDAVVIMTADLKDSIARAWCLSHDAGVDVSSKSMVLSAASQTTGKMASFLAADI